MILGPEANAMSDDSVKTIRGTFSTREAADRAVEHLVQEHGIDRADIFVQPQDQRNTAGTVSSGADAARNEAEGSQFEPALRGSVLVSADVSRDRLSQAEQALRAAGASEILTR
jgi:hypothetical protein